MNVNNGADDDYFGLNLNQEQSPNDIAVVD
jgi:hypothetical protein